MTTPLTTLYASHETNATSLYQSSIAMLVASGEFDGWFERGVPHGLCVIRRVFNYAYEQSDNKLFNTCFDDLVVGNKDFHRNWQAYLSQYWSERPARSYQEKLVNEMISSDDPMDGLFNAVTLYQHNHGPALLALF